MLKKLCRLGAKIRAFYKERQTSKRENNCSILAAAHKPIFRGRTADFLSGSNRVKICRDTELAAQYTINRFFVGQQNSALVG